MPQYLEVRTPEERRTDELQMEGLSENSIPVQESPAKRRRSSRFGVRRSSGLKPRSVARVYVPTLQERAHDLVAGSFGLALEIVNFALSMLIFFGCIAELYDENIYYSRSRTAFEAIATSFFIFDFGLHLFVAENRWKFVFSSHGMIDLATIIPSLIMFTDPNSHSSWMSVLRVLRIVRALRVLRLARYIKFKKHGFEYELWVFILSAIAVILCAAGVYQVLESGEYSENEQLHFHDSLYFVLVTVSTIGYGDITPRTELGHVFVIVLIIGIFTIVPAEVNKLNALAKQNNPWDKDFEVGSSGHVIVSGYNLTASTVLEFLQEFYHPSRGTIHLDVLFVSDEPPSSDLICVLEKQKYRRRTNYLRGSLMLDRDQRRAKMETATAVFFLANNRHEPAQQDAATILHAVSIRNYADKCGKHVDIYVQLLSRENDYETSSLLLGANATKTSKLKSMLLARAVVCPGSSTLILNLIRSYHLGQYTKRRTWVKLWIHEYLDGMTYQVFPIIFSTRFEHHKFDVVARHFYEKFGALLISVLSTNEDEAVSHTKPVRLAPFRSYIREGDIGFVIARTASDVIQIVNSYGYWEGGSGERRASESLLSTSVRVSSDTLWRRRSPHRNFYSGRRAASVTNIRLEMTSEPMSRDRREETAPSASIIECTKVGTPDTFQASGKPPPIRISRTRSMPSELNSPSTGSQLQVAIRTKDEQKIEGIFQRDHLRSSVKGQANHYVICSRSLSDAVSIASLLRTYSQREFECKEQESEQQQFPQCLRIVLLMAHQPTARDLMRVAEETSSDFLQGIVVVVGSPAKSADLGRVEAAKARHVVILPLDRSVAREEGHFSSTSAEFGLRGQTSWADEETLADFGVICSLLAAEANKQGLSRSASPCYHRRQSSRVSSDAGATPNAHTSFKRELKQGIPLESVKLRAMGRYPSLNPGIFRDKADIIDAALQQHDHQAVLAAERERTISSTWSPVSSSNILAVLHYACNAKLCRPCDEAVQDELPSLTPLFAGGGIFLSSLLNRIVCQAFYNPYATDVIEALANGSGGPSSSIPSASNTNSSQDTHRRLFEVELDAQYVGETFLGVFLDYISREMLVIGVLRHTSPELENLLPFVYTCPAPSTTMHANDRLYVLG